MSLADKTFYTNLSAQSQRAILLAAIHGLADKRSHPSIEKATDGHPPLLDLLSLLIAQVNVNTDYLIDWDYELTEEDIKYIEALIEKFDENLLEDQVPTEQTTDCWRCEGSGVIADHKGTIIICYTCHGKGVITT